MSERDWTAFSEALSEWQENPVTGTLREAMANQIEARKQWVSERYWAGQPVPEADRQALLLVEQWVEDFFESSAEDVRAVMEQEQ